MQVFSCANLWVKPPKISPNAKHLNKKPKTPPALIHGNRKKSSIKFFKHDHNMKFVVCLSTFVEQLPLFLLKYTTLYFGKNVSLLLVQPCLLQLRIFLHNFLTNKIV